MHKDTNFHLQTKKYQKKITIAIMLLPFHGVDNSKAGNPTSSRHSLTREASSSGHSFPSLPN